MDLDLPAHRPMWATHDVSDAGSLHAKHSLPLGPFLWAHTPQVQKQAQSSLLVMPDVFHLLIHLHDVNDCWELPSP